MSIPTLIEAAARNTAWWADDADDMRCALGVLQADHPALRHLERAEQMIHDAAVELLAPGGAYAEHGPVDGLCGPRPGRP